MYKVFFKDRIVFLTNNIERDLKSNFDAIFKYSNPKELNDFIDQFIDKKDIKTAYIYHYNIDELYKLFSIRFKVIHAAGGLVYNDKNEILFIHRLGKWDLPKGKAEKGESIEETATREVEEECGISNLEVIKQLKSTFHTYPLKDEIVLKRTYWYKMKYKGTEELVPQTEEDITEVCWRNIDDLEDVYSNTYPSIKDIISKYV